MVNPEHVQALREKHSTLERRINTENQRPHPDDVRIAELKKKKLQLKDEISRLEH
ncbi:DUF465 domain-containing protein [Limibacillus halophilus]|uniref:DUF465 domain-containing protein n=1 Tax=Limibacillus halophilus TaxID=1579333 RepID=A0A839T120_9PROT|nr:DUF465 domain-containing protein [Limibacillus halophilus]MBB3066843.1 hypothetical protein [Limibacillus halophilus]